MWSCMCVFVCVCVEFVCDGGEKREVCLSLRLCACLRRRGCACFYGEGRREGGGLVGVLEDAGGAVRGGGGGVVLSLGAAMRSLGASLDMEP